MRLLRLDPISAWAGRYEYEEPLHSEGTLLDELRSSVGSEDTVAKHVLQMHSIISELPASIADLYLPWALSPESYRFGGEAHLQKRILHLLGAMHSAGFPTDKITESIWARQTIHPSGFNATPRIARFSGYSYVIFPAPTTYWLYAICEALSAAAVGLPINDKKLSLYLRYLVAARSFERYATEVSALNLDKLIDEIVHRGEVEDVDAGQPQPGALVLNMITAVENFILCHEIAHLVLEHGNDGTTTAEAAADELALEMLRSISPEKFGYMPVSGLEARHMPQFGYLTLRFWTEVRLAAEQRVLPFVWDTREQVDQQKLKLHSIRDARTRQMQMVGVLNQLEICDAIQLTANGLVRVVERLVNIPLKRQETDRMRSLARHLAFEDYDELKRRYGVGPFQTGRSG